jgi:hypothetical protein
LSDLAILPGFRVLKMNKGGRVSHHRTSVRLVVSIDRDAAPDLPIFDPPLRECCPEKSMLIVAIGHGSV